MSDSTRNTLNSWISSTTRESPIILTGEDDNELAQLVKYACQVAVCRESSSPCGKCQSCLQALNGSHPDILTIDGDGKTISIATVKKVLERMTRASFGGVRVVIIPQAERLTNEAVSALLKPLEEPSTATRYLLTTKYRRRILPTIRSRSRLVVIPGSHRTSLIKGTLPTSMTLGAHQGPLSEEELDALTSFLRTTLSEKGSSPALLRSFLRLRDYYKIRSARGNTKLAAEIVLQSLSFIV